MQLTDFDFPFDPSLVAVRPVEPRDHARLLVMNRSTGGLEHHYVCDLPRLLRAGDLLVVNDTKVLPARVPAKKRRTGGPVELLFVKDRGCGVWDVLVKGRLRPGDIIDITHETQATVLERSAAGTTVKLDSRQPAVELFRTVGLMPLPPYIKRAPTKDDREWYQTVFAAAEGAIAAPTAGLHFTPRLLQTLPQHQISLGRLTLHVGVGTFKPVTVDHIEKHRMAGEYVEVKGELVDTIQRTKAAGGRVVAVGTTVVRALETAAIDGTLKPFRGETSLFITPGFRFHVIDALLTNFHLPRTTLLMLVSAVAGLERLRHAYEEAVSTRYRFYSYGDAMAIL